MGVRDRLKQLLGSPSPEESKTSPSIVENTLQNVHVNAQLDTVKLSKLVDSKDVELLNSLGGVDGIAGHLSVQLTVGLLDSTRFTSQRVFGNNVLPGRKSPSALQLMLSAFLDKILLMLTAAALVSLGIGIYQDLHDNTMTHWIEGAAILVAVIIVVMVNALNDLQRERQFRKLNARAKDRLVNILRDGQPSRISIFDLAVGDVCLLEPGVSIR
jgi:Ca2+-transporting ATPase